MRLAIDGIGGDSALVMPQCTHCDAFVSQNFARVFGDENGLIHACPNCAANAGIAGTTVERRSRA